MDIGVADATELDFDFDIARAGIATLDGRELHRRRTVIAGIG